MTNSFCLGRACISMTMKFINSGVTIFEILYAFLRLSISGIKDQRGIETHRIEPWNGHGKEM